MVKLYQYQGVVSEKPHPLGQPFKIWPIHEAFLKYNFQHQHMLSCKRVESQVRFKGFGTSDVETKKIIDYLIEAGCLVKRTLDRGMDIYELTKIGKLVLK